ncbi:MAG: alanine--glyoxylate aminotransferase [Chloroflexi bacterium]|nr:alanine--glyoxylate aminotransferase [Chloroflexota bacterium]|tara:strand:- start:4475 stop:5662 length:1188 start_codon:yes stop_codon:yes gene_type:complete
MPNGPVGELIPPRRVLLGPGPSDVNPRVLRAMATPVLGYLDPDFIELMDGVANMLRDIFGTENGFTLPVSGTGSAGMEAGLANLLEPGDVAVIGENGFFGARLVEIAKRQGATVDVVSADWGKPIDPNEIENALKRNEKVKLVAVVHAETSTGVLQPLEEIAAITKQYNALLLVDAVTSLGGTPVNMDKIGIDFCYSGTQKCLGAPPGLSPVAISEKALEVIENRTTTPRTWYLDLGLLRKYWAGGTRVYHHTPPMSMIYALREALRVVLEDGLENRYARHEKNALALRAGLRNMGLNLLVPDEYCLYQLTTIEIPEGINDQTLRTSLREDYGIEIGGGLGQFAGKAWRIGLMGESSTQSNVLMVLSSLEKLLTNSGFEVGSGSGVKAATEIFNT